MYVYSTERKSIALGFCKYPCALSERSLQHDIAEAGVTSTPAIQVCYTIF